MKHYYVNIRVDSTSCDCEIKCGLSGEQIILTEQKSKVDPNARLVKDLSSFILTSK